MKSIFTLLFLASITIVSNAQQTASFKEKTFLWLTDTAKFATVQENHTVLLKYVPKKLKVYDTVALFKGNLKNEPLVLSQVEKVVDYDNAKIFNIDLAHFKNSRLFGEIKQVKNRLHFYPWPFTSGDTKDTAYLNNLFKENEFIIDIPERTVVKVNYNAWQYGALTLPIKFYMGTKGDTLKNNVETDVNLNFMVGRKWGKKKYYHLPNEAEGSTYEKGYSINLVLGLSKLTIDDSNTTPKNAATTNVAALSTGIAFGIQYKKIGIFLATGLDSPLSSKVKDWNFRHQPWLGIGLGLGLD